MRASHDPLAPVVPCTSHRAEKIIWGLNFFQYENTGSQFFHFRASEPETSRLSGTLLAVHKLAVPSRLVFPSGGPEPSCFRSNRSFTYNGYKDEARAVP